MNTDLELYRIFCKVVEYKNISRTARSMYISQSAITQSIQKLEGNLGGKVFYRSKNGVELTEEGKSLYEYVKDSVEIINNAENVFLQYSNLEKGKIRIGSENNLQLDLISEPLLEFIKRYPQININTNNEITETLMQELVDGELDIVVLNLLYNNKNYSNIEYIPLKKTKFCFFASKNYFKDKPIKNLKEVENHTLILPNAYSSEKKILDELCSKEKINLNANYEVSNISIMKKMALNDIGIGFTNKENLKDIEDKIIIKEVETIDEGIAILKNNIANKAATELIKVIKHYYKQN